MPDAVNNLISIAAKRAEAEEAARVAAWEGSTGDPKNYDIMDAIDAAKRRIAEAKAKDEPAYKHALVILYREAQVLDDGTDIGGTSYMQAGSAAIVEQMGMLTLAQHMLLERD